ncbi:MAG: type IX secretion system outer membrane channel protein PorV [Saprospiraceae bacterium]|nr:type IX secretion system outer membrane channel protein PorV [Saprospiraceae bacterium]HRG67827.1 type IX secretion system outer membrane channel protein PorV [Saprospiraceae bacterium]
MRFLISCSFLVLSLTISAQTWNPAKGCIVDASGECLQNTILTALPFLRINPDTRSGGLGDAGVALTTDPNAMHHNAARLAWAENNMGISATYSPWLRNLGIDDIYLLYLSGYYKIDKFQTAGLAVRYFSLGKIDFRDENGNDIGTGQPNEFEIAAAYSRKLSDVFSASLSAKFAYSNLATGKTVGAYDITSAKTFGADLGFLYRNKLGASGRRNYLNVGLAITNIGSKVTYIKGLVKDFIPTNLALGAAYEMNFDDYNSLTTTLEINKLLIPSPRKPGDPLYDVDNNKIADYREKSLFEGIFGSLNDAPGGGKEELQELMYSVGMEYWYDKQFAVRLGYFHENALKGNRKYMTLGCGVKYNVFGLNLSYLVPTTNNRSPLANTIRFSISYDFDGGTSSKQGAE